MKKLLFTVVSALAIAGVAMAADSTQFGVLKVQSSAAKTIVGVPWLETGTGSGDVSVANLVLTSGLNNGDELRLYGSDGKMSESWQLTNGKWVGGGTVNGDNDVQQSGNDTTGIARGKAIMLIRKGTIADCFYIMGKPADSEAGSTTAVGGSDTTPAYSLIAPSRTSATNVGKLTLTGGTTLKEYLIIGQGNLIVTLTWEKWKEGDVDKQGWYNPRTDEYDDVSIPAGQGVWFMSRSPGNKTVSWN